MRYFHDGALSLGRVDVPDDADVQAFMDAPNAWWQPYSGEWREANRPDVQVEVLGPSAYLDRIPDSTVARVQAEIRARLGGRGSRLNPTKDATA